MNTLTRFVAEFCKLARLFRADPRAVAAGVIAPTAILLVFWITFGTMSSLNVAIVNHDTGPLGAALQTQILAQVSPAGGQPYFTSPTSDETEAMDLYTSGRIAGVIVIGEDFSTSVETRSEPTIEFYFNNYSTDMAKNLRLYLQEGIVAFYQTEYPGYDLHVDERLTVDSQVDWFHLIAVGVFMLAFQIGAMFSLLYLLFSEMTWRTQIEYALSPGGQGPFWIARLVFSLLLGMVTATISGVLIWVLSGLNVAHILSAVIGPTLLITSIWMSLAAILALTVKRFAPSAVTAMVAAVLCWFMSGGTSPVRYLAGPSRWLAELIPNTWALDLARASGFGYPISHPELRHALLWVVCLIMISGATVAYYRRFARRSLKASRTRSYPSRRPALSGRRPSDHAEQ